MSDVKNTPKLRFPQFSGDWEMRKLGEIAKMYSGGTPSISNKAYYGTDIPFIRSGEIYSDKTELFLSQEGFDKSSAKMVRQGDILYALYGATSGEVSRSLINGAINQAILAIIPNEQYESEFISQFLAGQKERIIATYLQGGQGNLSGEIVKNLTINIPKDNAEQTAIGNFFRQLDELIKLHERKLDHTNALKKGLLQKMFPKNGETVPEIRFPEFSGDWEMRKLGEIGEIITGSTPSTQRPEYYDDEKNGMLWVTPTDIAKNITTKTEKYLSQKGQKVARIAPKNTILVTCIASIGKNTLLGEHGSFNQQINGLVPNFEKFDPYFLYSASYFWSDYMKKMAGSATMQIVNKTEFSKIMTAVPTLKEQTAIGNFFRQLDELIALRQRKLEHLKELKKALLQQIFVLGA